MGSVMLAPDEAATLLRQVLHILATGNARVSVCLEVAGVVATITHLATDHAAGVRVDEDKPLRANHGAVTVLHIESPLDDAAIGARLNEDGIYPLSGAGGLKLFVDIRFADAERLFKLFESLCFGLLLGYGLSDDRSALVECRLRFDSMLSLRMARQIHLDVIAGIRQAWTGASFWSPGRLPGKLIERRARAPKYRLAFGCVRTGRMPLEP